VPSVTMTALAFPAGHVGLRHEMGIVSRRGSHVFFEVSSQECRLPRCCPVLQLGHGRTHADYQPS
jgi:hypothetical protein